jgi:hypothetical protein
LLGVGVALSHEYRRGATDVRLPHPDSRDQTHIDSKYAAPAQSEQLGLFPWLFSHPGGSAGTSPVQFGFFSTTCELLSVHAGGLFIGGSPLAGSAKAKPKATIVTGLKTLVQMRMSSQPDFVKISFV